MMKLPLVISVPPVTLSPAAFSTAWLARQHRFVNSTGAIADCSVDRNALARTDAEAVAGFY